MSDDWWLWFSAMMLKIGRYGDEYHDDGCGLGEFTMVLSENWLETEADYNGLWRFIASI